MKRYRLLWRLLFVLLAAPLFCKAQKTCAELTPQLILSDTGWQVSREPGSACRYVTHALNYRNKPNVGTLEIVFKDPSINSEADFNSRLNEEANRGMRCSLVLNLGQRAAWCLDNSLSNYDLWILRGKDAALMRFAGWPTLSNGLRGTAVGFAEVIFGSAPKEAPLAAPKN